MAIDSAAKRASALAFGGEGFADLIPAGSNLDTANERAAATFGYYGTLSGAAYSPAFDRRRRVQAVLAWLRRDDGLLR